MDKDMIKRFSHGGWPSGNQEDCFEVVNPATGKVIAMVEGADELSVNSAVQRAHEAWKSWRIVPPQQRGKLLIQCAAAIREYADEIGKIEAEEMGKPFTQARQFDVEFCINAFEMFGGMTHCLQSEVKEQGSMLGISTLEPYGVIGAIVPFNWPPIHTAGKIAPALAAGNTIVVKPPEQCPFTVMRIIEIINDILPEGVVTAIAGTGACGAALAANPLVRMISFTGSPDTGRKVLKAAAENFTPALMELGGKNPLIVFEDADVELALRGIVDGAYFNQGEACTAASRILIHRSLYDNIAARLSEVVPKLVVGNPMNLETHVGPLVTAAQKEKVCNYIEIGKKEGAHIAAEAPLPEDLDLAEGFFVKPTLFVDVTPDMRIAKEEIFGPVTVLIPFDTYEEAIEIANGTDFGLVAGVYSRNFETCWKASREIEAGIVFANNYHRNFLGTAFGGCKNSGYGREHTLETIKEFGKTKTVRIPTGIGEIPEWFAVTDVFSE